MLIHTVRWSTIRDTKPFDWVTSCDSAHNTRRELTAGACPLKISIAAVYQDLILNTEQCDIDRSQTCGETQTTKL